MTKMITREFLNLNVDALVYDREEKTTKTAKVILPDKNYTERTIENAINNVLGTRYKLIEVIATEKARELRGMYINDFYANSFPLDENRKKVVEE